MHNCPTITRMSEIEDRSGTVRDPEDFATARKVVVSRMIKTSMPPGDIEMFMQYTTIIQALEIAEGVARVAAKKRGIGV